MDSQLGLGYHHSSSAGNEQGHDNQASSSSASDYVDSVMRQYLAQCLEYHQEQEALRQEQKSKVEFVKPQHDADLPPVDNLPPPLQSSDATAALATDSTPTSVPADVLLRVEEGRQRAQAILERFRQQQQDYVDGKLVVRTTPPATIEGDPSIYRQQRLIGFQREMERKNEAMLRNFAYLERRDRQRLIAMSAEMEASRVAEGQAHDRYLASLEERKRMRQQQGQNLHSTAALGSNQRKRVEGQKKKVLCGQEDASVALYLSGMPTDGSADDDFVRQLFESYGKIRKVHFYRDKGSGKLKGDGLVIFQLKTSNEAGPLVASVCSQMNGVELPSGCVIRVEPADSSFSSVKTSHYGASPASEEEALGVEKQSVAGSDGDDLDEFFDSL